MVTMANSVHNDWQEKNSEVPEEIAEIEWFDQPHEEIEEIDTVLSETGESMNHGHIQTMGGLGEACPIATPKMLAE